MKTIKSILFIGLLLVVLLGCASNDPGLIQRDFDSTVETIGENNKSGGTGINSSASTDGSAYIYGRFFLSQMNRSGLEDDGNPLYGLIVKNIDTDEEFIFVLEGVANATTQLAAVPPGTYRIESLNRLYEDGNEIIPIRPVVMDLTLGVSDEKRAEAEEARANDDDYTLSETFDAAVANYNREFTVEKNSALYLGDFILSYNYYVQNGGNIIYYYTSTQTFPPLDRYDETTESLYARFPYMKDESIEYSSNMDYVTRYLPWDNFFTVFEQTGKAVEKSR